MSSNERLADFGSDERWKLWLITVQPRSFTAQRSASRSFEFAECSLHSGAWPCGLFASLFLMIPWTFCEWSDVVGDRDRDRVLQVVDPLGLVEKDRCDLLALRELLDRTSAHARKDDRGRVVDADLLRAQVLCDLAHAVRELHDRLGSHCGRTGHLNVSFLPLQRAFFVRLGWLDALGPDGDVQSLVRTGFLQAGLQVLVQLPETGGPLSLKPLDQCRLVDPLPRLVERERDRRAGPAVDALHQ